MSKSAIRDWLATGPRDGFASNPVHAARWSQFLEVFGFYPPRDYRSFIEHFGFGDLGETWNFGNGWSTRDPEAMRAAFETRTLWPYMEPVPGEVLDPNTRFAQFLGELTHIRPFVIADREAEEFLCWRRLGIANPEHWDVVVVDLDMMTIEPIAVSFHNAIVAWYERGFGATDSPPDIDRLSWEHSCPFSGSVSDNLPGAGSSVSDNPPGEGGRGR